MINNQQIPRNMQTNATQLKRNGFQIIKSMIYNTCHSSICYNLFWASQKLGRASKSHLLLAWHGKFVLNYVGACFYETLFLKPL